MGGFLDRWQRLRYAPLLSQLVVTRRCNLDCKYCTEFDRTSEPVPTAVLRRRIDRIAELGSAAIDLTGGEPLLHPDIAPLVAHARSRRFAGVRMISNGYLLSREIVDELNEAGLQQLQVSVDGVAPNDVTVKVLRPLRPKLEMLAERARFKVVLSAVVGSGASADDVEEVVRFARAHLFRPRILLIHGGDGQLAMSPRDLRAYARVKALIGRHWTSSTTVARSSPAARPPSAAGPAAATSTSRRPAT